MIASNLFDAAALRDAALASVENNAKPFGERALAMLRTFKGSVGTGEDIRQWITAAGIEPHHPNAWGSFIMRAVKTGVCVPTGEWAHMKGAKSHARLTRLYRIAG